MSNTPSELTIRLRENPLWLRLSRHRYFQLVHDAPLTHEQVTIFLGQWWHPLHYFPTFLARCIAVFPDVASKSAISSILHQELGCGDPRRAHEMIYGDTVEGAGFSRQVVTGSPPFPETAALVAGYERASREHWSALGFVFATEVTDLLMVSGIGTAIERVAGRRDLEWVRIHVEQEPDHVEEATRATTVRYTLSEQDQILAAAEDMWRLWAGFFDRLEREIDLPTSWEPAPRLVEIGP